MGFYSNYLEKNRDIIDINRNREELMFKLKAEKAGSLLMESERELQFAHVYMNNNQYHFHNANAYYPQQVLHLDKSKKCKQEQQRIDSLTTAEYFSELINNESESLKQGINESYEEMSDSIEKAKFYKRSGGFVSKVAFLLGKTDEITEKYSKQFDESNDSIVTFLRAENEWQEMSNIDKVDVLLTRWELEKTTDLNIEDVKVFGVQQNQTEQLSQEEILNQMNEQN